MQNIRDRLLAMQRQDLQLRDRLIHRSALSDGYHPEMRALHEKNADQMAEILKDIGWPSETLVGEDASEAAWLVVQHSISRPSLMRTAHRLIEEACTRGDASAMRAAMLEDRIRYMEGRPQRFGTTLSWDDAGGLSPGPLEDERNVDERRLAVGLQPLAAALSEARKVAAAAGERSPANLEEHRLGAMRFAKEMGWR